MRVAPYRIFQGPIGGPATFTASRNLFGSTCGAKAVKATAEFRF